ncbi:hypothetical protein [Helicovermis profundi]|uniref:DUF2680 domain-containing protein n=1 Tax=Helicovermis profundi TaxID=3065157 RepID=A0AAU9E6M2_9FIRM|nr:hypothetical protein HLPR_06280 [Clostridia bacterium S502]
MKIKKFTATLLIGVMALGFGALSFADTPAETYANLAGTTVENAFNERSADKTFGQMADEKGFLEEFTKAMLDDKKEWLDSLVENGTLTKEKEDEILAKIGEDCTLNPGSQRGIMREYGLSYGRDNNMGLRDGSGFGRKNNSGLRDGSGRSNGRGNGFRNGTGRDK